MIKFNCQPMSHNFGRPFSQRLYLPQVKQYDLNSSINVKAFILVKSPFLPHLAQMRPRFSHLPCKPNSKRTVHYKDGSHEQKEVEPIEIVPPDALGSPRAVVVIPFNADVTVAAVESLPWYVEPALPAEPMIHSNKRGSDDSVLVLLFYWFGDAWVAEGYQEIREALPAAYYLCDCFCPEVLDFGIDVADEEIADQREDQKSWQEAEIQLEYFVQSGPRKRVSLGSQHYQVFTVGQATLIVVCFVGHELFRLLFMFDLRGSFASLVVCGSCLLRSIQGLGWLFDCAVRNDRFLQCGLLQLHLSELYNKQKSIPNSFNNYLQTILEEYQLCEDDLQGLLFALVTPFRLLLSYHKITILSQQSDYQLLA